MRSAATKKVIHRTLGAERRWWAGSSTSRPTEHRSTVLEMI